MTADDAAQKQLDRQALREEIAHTRSALADTAEALASKFDVTGRVRARVDRTSPVMAGAAAAAIVVGVSLLIWALRRR